MSNRYPSIPAEAQPRRNAAAKPIQKSSDIAVPHVMRSAVISAMADASRSIYLLEAAGLLDLSQYSEADRVLRISGIGGSDGMTRLLILRHLEDWGICDAAAAIAARCQEGSKEAANRLLRQEISCFWLPQG